VGEGTGFMRKLPIYFITPVWGRVYVRTYLDIVLPSQLAPNNIPAIPDNSQSRYIICTTRDDAKTIKDSRYFRQLEDILPVDLLTVDASIASPHEVMSDCYRQGILAAEANDAVPAFLTPDLVHADGNFRALWRWIEEGKHVVFVTGIRTEKEGVTADLKASFLASNGAIVIQPRDLVRIGLENLHTIGRASWFKEGDEDLIPANLYWRAGNEGLIARCFHLHPIIVCPQRQNTVFRGTVDDDYVEVACPKPDHDYVVLDSDEFMMIEVSDATRRMPTNFRKGSLRDVVVWAEQFANDRHRRLFDVPIKLHVGVMTPACWAAAEAEAASVAHVIRRELNTSTFALLLRGGQGMTGRIVRRALNAEMRRSNSVRMADAQLEWWARSTAMLAYSVQTIEMILIRGGLEAYRRLVGVAGILVETIRRLGFGTPVKPRYFSPRWEAYKEINRALEAAVGTVRDGAVIAASTSRWHERPLRQLVVKFEDGSMCLVDRKSGQHVPLGSLPLILVDRNVPDERKLLDFLRALRKVLSKEGRLVIVAQNKGFWPARGEPCIDAISVSAKLAEAGFVVTGQRRLDNSVAVAAARFGVDLFAWDSRLRRLTVLYPIYVFVQVGLAIPCWMLAKPIIMRLARWFMYRPGSITEERPYFASLSVAMKLGEEMNPKGRTCRSEHGEAA
jgi:hypothetical protein